MWKCRSCDSECEDNFDACWKCGLARDGSEISTVNPSSSVPENMICPNCGSHMMRGTALVHGTLLGFLWVGWSWQHLWFRCPPKGEEQAAELKIINCGNRKPSFRCAGCGTLVIHPGDEV